MAVFTSSQLFRRNIILVGNLVNANGCCTTDLGNCSWTNIGYTSIYFCKYTNDGKTYSGLKTRLQPLPETSIRVEINAQKKGSKAT